MIFKVLTQGAAALDEDMQIIGEGNNVALADAEPAAGMMANLHRQYPE
jgi:hypothetical protein